MTAAERDELVRLRRENKQLRVERDILSRAAAWLAREDRSGAVRVFDYEREPRLPYAATASASCQAARRQLLDDPKALADRATILQLLNRARSSTLYGMLTAGLSTSSGATPRDRSQRRVKT